MRSTYLMDHTFAEIEAFFAGHDFSALNTSICLAGWRAWSFYASEIV